MIIDNKMNKITFGVRNTLALLVPLGAMFILAASGCESNQGVPGSAVKVAKVDTEYVYEANVSKFVSDYREAQRTSISNFIGFPPDEILAAREYAIDAEVRAEIKRLPGINISGIEVRSLADGQVEDLAWDLYGQLTDENADFEQLARQYTDSESFIARNGGRLQPFGFVDNPEPYQIRTYNMSPGDMTEPFSSWDGWRIIRLNEITEDPYSGPIYDISMILLQPDLSKAEASIIDELAEGHTIEILDPKYNSRRALIAGNFEEARQLAQDAVERNQSDDLAHYLLARGLWELDRFDEAIQEIEIAATHGRIADAFIPYYHFIRGEWLEELDRDDDALEAFHTSFENWRQDIILAYDLKDAFTRLADEEYLQIIQEEIDIITSQDSIALTFGQRHPGGGVIMTDQGESSGSSVIYEPGYRD